MHGVGAMILAAGASMRLGEPKQLLKFEGETLLRRTVKAALAADCEPVAVVGGNAGDRVGDELRGLPVNFVLNGEWRRGVGTSIKCGLGHLQGIAPNLRAVIILGCDQPFVSRATIRALMGGEKPVVASAYAGTVGIPALFDSRFFRALASLPDDSGAKSLIQSNSHDVAIVPFPEGAIDIDTQADYAKLHPSSKPESSKSSGSMETA